MRYPASEKAEIIRLVEQSHLPAKRTLDKLGIPRATFYRWYDRYLDGGAEALADHRSRLDRIWNRIPDDVRRQIIDLALELPELSPRELEVRLTDEQKYFVSEASVYRLLKAHDLITSPAYVVIKAANEFKDKTTAINQLWQTDFTYLKITGWAPLGYEVRDRKLVVNEVDAKLVHSIFQRFLKTGSATTLARELIAKNVRNKYGKLIDKGILYKMLNNPVYIGVAVHKGVSYPGEHVGIIDQKIWDKVQARFQEGARKRAATTRAQTPSLLKGIIFG